jgi:hypothetical protein
LGVGPGMDKNVRQTAPDGSKDQVGSEGQDIGQQAKEGRPQETPPPPQHQAAPEAMGN